MPTRLLLLLCLLGAAAVARAGEGDVRPAAATKPAEKVAAKPVDSSDPKAAATPPAGHSMHGEAFNEGPRQKPYLMSGMSAVHFPITTKVPLAQEFFDQGMSQLHGFWYFEAERSFRQVATLDPTCAMAYWGMAMANANNDKRAKEFIETGNQAEGFGRCARGRLDRCAGRPGMPARTTPSAARSTSRRWSGWFKMTPTTSRPRPCWPCRFGRTAVG